MAKEEVVQFAIGIDLGTTNSCVAAWKHNKIEILENKQGNRTTPSCVSFTEDEELIGDGGKRLSATNAANTVFGIKRVMGRGYHDAFVQQQIKLWPFTVMPGEDGRPQIVVTHKGEERKFFPEEISAMVLRYMKEIAGLKLGAPVKDAVITVPANFSDSQRRTTKNAGDAAGLNVLRILNEPTAAAMAYYLEDASWREGKRNALVFDLGGGTLDVSILAMENSNLSIKSTAGDTHLGGEDFDDRLLRFLIQEVKKKHGVDISGIPKAVGRMRAECERAKKDLSFAQQTSIDLAYIHQDVESFHYRFTRAKFEDLNMDYFKRCMDVVAKCLEDAKMQKGEIHDVVLAGGSSRIPKVKQLLEELFGPGKLRCTINPDEAIAHGAAVQAAKLVGAGEKRVQNLVVGDITPLSLGTTVSGGSMRVIIPRNTCIPVRREARFFPAYDNETEVYIHILEGERSLASLNNLLAEFTFGPLPRARSCDNGLVLGLEVDANGILTVWAEHSKSGLRKDVKITNLHGRIAAQEIESRIKNAHEHRSEDEQQAEKCWNRYHLKCLINSGRSRIQSSHKLTGERRRTLEHEVNKTDEWLKRNQEAEATVFFNKWEELEKILGKYIDMKDLTIGEHRFNEWERTFGFNTLSM